MRVYVCAHTPFPDNILLNIRRVGTAPPTDHRRLIRAIRHRTLRPVPPLSILKVRPTAEGEAREASEGVSSVRAEEVHTGGGLRIPSGAPALAVEGVNMPRV